MSLRFIPVLLVCLGVFSRLVPHSPNLTPLTAIALFSGIYLPKKWSLLVPLLAMFISDIFIGFYGIGMLFVYLGIALQVMIGSWSFWKKSENLWVIGVGSIFASCVFFTVSNFGAWLTMPDYYSRDLSGLWQSYVAAIPFFKWQTDLLFTHALFGFYEGVKYLTRKYVPKLSSAL